MKKILFIIVMTLGLSGYAQVGVGTSSPDASAQLDVTAANKGILIPRVKLTGSADAVTVPSPKESLLVYNTETAGDVVPGFYYWNAVKWTALAGGGGAVGNIAIANGGTGATTAAAALTNLGAQSAANLTTVLGNLTDHYPSESAVKTYVDNAGFALQTDLVTENNRAVTAESALQNSIDGAVTSINAKATTAALAAETVRAVGVEDLKEDLSNKSNVIDVQTTDDKYPSVKAVRTYIDAMPSFYGTDGTLTGARVVSLGNNDLTFTTGVGKLVIDGNLKKDGSVSSKFEVVNTTTYTVPNTVNTLVYKGGAASVFTMPSAAANPGMEFKIFNVSGFSVTFPAGTFSPNSTNATVFNGTAAILFSDGVIWYLLLGA